MADIRSLLTMMLQQGASDMILTAGYKPYIKVNGVMHIAYAPSLAQGETAELTATLDGVLALPTLAGPLRPALQVHRARLDEPSGRDQATMQRYEASLSQKPTLSAGLGLLRTACRVPRLRKEEPTPLAKAAKAVAGLTVPVALKTALWSLVAQKSSDADELAALIDKAIWSSYRLFPGNYLAADVPGKASTIEQSAFLTRQSEVPQEHKAIWRAMYAKPVENASKV